MRPELFAEIFCGRKVNYNNNMKHGTLLYRCRADKNYIGKLNSFCTVEALKELWKTVISL